MTRYYQERRQLQAPLARRAQSLFNSLDIKQTLQHLAQTGYALGLRVPEEQVNRILNFRLQNLPSYSRDPHQRCAAISEIAHDPKLLAVVTQHLGAEPILFSSHLYWTQPPATPRAWQRTLAAKSRFHYDVGDFRMLSVFIYLTDVDENCGPHLVIAGTHRHKTPRQLLSRYLDDRIAYDTYPSAIQPITGARGTGFFEELTCYHKHSVGQKPRLMLNITYTLQRKPRQKRNSRQLASFAE